MFRPAATGTLLEQPSITGQHCDSALAWSDGISLSNSLFSAPGGLQFACERPDGLRIRARQDA
jgi:hypothetical protein